MAEVGCLENPHGDLPLLVTFEVTPLPLGLHFHEIEDMAFLFRKIMNLGRHGLKELLLVAGNIFRKFYVLVCFSTSSWQIFRS